MFTHLQKSCMNTVFYNSKHSKEYLFWKNFIWNPVTVIFLSTARGACFMCRFMGEQKRFSNLHWRRAVRKLIFNLCTLYNPLICDKKLTTLLHLLFYKFKWILMWLRWISLCNNIHISTERSLSSLSLKDQIHDNLFSNKT